MTDTTYLLEARGIVKNYRHVEVNNTQGAPTGVREAG